MRCLWLALLLACLSVPGHAAPLPTAQELMARINARDHDLSRLHCQVDIGLDLAILPLTFGGDLYYQRPDHVRLVFRDLPQVVRLQRDVFRDVVPHNRRLEAYVLKVEGEVTLDRVPAWKVAARPRQSSDNVRLGELWVREDDLTIPRIVLHYKDGATVSADVQYDQVEKYRLPSQLDLQFELPHLSARAQADLHDYEVNRPLPAHIFETIAR